jgi:hypothetical protein
MHETKSSWTSVWSMKRPMVIKVKTSWKGEVAIGLHRVREVISKKEKLLIKHNGEDMWLFPEEIEKAMRIDLKIYYDKKTEKPYQLAYFKWKPNNKQNKLF